MQQLVLVSEQAIEILDIRSFMAIEHVLFDALRLASPSHVGINPGTVPFQDSVCDIQHSVHVYKGKIFVMVSLMLFD